MLRLQLQYRVLLENHESKDKTLVEMVGFVRGIGGAWVEVRLVGPSGIPKIHNYRGALELRVSMAA